MSTSSTSTSSKGPSANGGDGEGDGEFYMVVVLKTEVGVVVIEPGKESRVAARYTTSTGEIWSAGVCNVNGTSTPTHTTI